MIEFALPDVGEGLTEAEIVAWHVAVGDVVEVNQTLVDIETAKSVVDLPSPAAGTIVAIHVQSGETVDVGVTIVSIEDGSVAPDVDVEESPLVLVGTGPSAAVPRRRRLSRAAGTAVGGEHPAPPAEAVATMGTRAKPPVRLLAKQLGVDLDTVSPSSGEIISRADVEAAAAGSLPAATSRVSTDSSIRETRIPIRGVRKATAAAMTRSAFTAPHVTEWLTVDVTRSMELLRRLKTDRSWDGVRLTPLVFVAKAVLVAIRLHPAINARWDEPAQEIVVQHYVNLGIAAATPRGLVVPNIKNSETLDLRALASALDNLVRAARAGKVSPTDMRGGTITITNIGALGVDAGTPILNPGESAILALGAIREMPWVVEGAVVPRMVTQLAMSFDHRLVDGELGSNVLAEVGRLLGDPAQAFLHI